VQRKSTAVRVFELLMVAYMAEVGSGSTGHCLLSASAPAKDAGVCFGRSCGSGDDGVLGEDTVLHGMEVVIAIFYTKVCQVEPELGLTVRFLQLFLATGQSTAVHGQGRPILGYGLLQEPHGAVFRLAYIKNVSILSKRAGGILGYPAGITVAVADYDHRYGVVCGFTVHGIFPLACGFSRNGTRRDIRPAGCGLPPTAVGNRPGS
jgi:hypothetical protein